MCCELSQQSCITSYELLKSAILLLYLKKQTFFLVKPKLKKEKLKTKNIVYLDTTRILER